MIRQAFFKGMLLTTIIMTALLLPACSSKASRDEAPTSTPLPTPMIPTKPTYQVKRGDILSTVDFTGRVVPQTEQTLFFHTDGRVRTIYLKEGSPVKKGQVLADLEVLNNLERQQALGKLAIDRAEIQLAVAQLELEQTISKAYTKDQKNYDVVYKQYGVKLAEIALNETKLNNEDLASSIANAQLVAPFDGVLLSCYLTIGSPAEAFKEAMVVADPSVLEISAELLGSSSGKIEKGLRAIISSSTHPSLEATGMVRALPLLNLSDSTANMGQNTTTRISLDTPASQLGLEIGDVVQVKVIVEEKKGTLYLLPQAIRTFEGRKFVIVQDAQGQHSVDVKVGIQSEDKIEILSGLEEGQIVQAP